MLVAFATPARAQSRWRIEAGPIVYFVDHATTPQNEAGRHTWLGGGVTATRGRWSAALEGLFGHLPDSGASGERDTRVTRLTLQFQPTEWIALGPEIEALRYSADDGIALWRLIGVGFTSHTTLGTERLEATLAGAWLPLTTTVGDNDLDPAARFETALVYRVRSRISLTLAYRTEVLAFAASSNRERISGLLFGASLRVLGRP